MTFHIKGGGFESENQIINFDVFFKMGILLEYPTILILTLILTKTLTLILTLILTLNLTLILILILIKW